MRIKLLSLTILSLLSISSVNAQQTKASNINQDSVRYYYDTVKTVCHYVGNLNTGQVLSSYCLRIIKSRMDFVPPTNQQLQNDSFTVKKQKTPVEAYYFIPVIVPADKKDKNSKPSQGYVQIPNEFILQDFNINFDKYLLEQQRKQQMNSRKK